MLRRSRPLADPVTVHLDGEAVAAERGEPIAVALLAAGKGTLARSPKVHRPRGPSCLRGACDGCLARVDGEPNVMTCLRPVRGGEQVETQNVVGTRQADLLRVADWFFPKGIDHHHLMAGVPGASELLQGFARKLAGLGRLPEEPLAPRTARRLDVDVLVVGGGLSGVSVAAALAGADRRVCLVDDGLALGGSAAGAPEIAAEIARAPLEGVRVQTASVAAGVYKTGDGAREVLVASSAGARIVRARALVFATGAHDGVLGVPNNDLPGVISARALCRMAAVGVVPDGPVAIVGGGFWADTLASMLGGDRVTRLAADRVVAIKGTARARSVVASDTPGGKQRSVKVAVVAVATRPSPAFEVAAQAGADVRYVESVGYVPVRDARGRAADGVWVAGECAGLEIDPAALRDDARAVAHDVIASLR